MENESVILPGSYDPITIGHLKIIEKVAKMYKTVYVVAFRNPEKTYMFTDEERLEMLRVTLDAFPNVTVDLSQGRVVDYVKEHRIGHIIKGVRGERDLAYERMQADVNMELGGVYTEYLRAQPRYAAISSTEAKRAIRDGRDLTGLLPPPVIEFLRKR